VKLIVVIISIICVCGFAWIASQRSHADLHHTLALKGIAQNGATIGVVADKLRKQGNLPVETETFQKEYSLAFRGRWLYSTNAAGDLQLSHSNYVTFLLDRTNGSVRLLKYSDLEASDAVSIFKPVDFSHPFSGTNWPVCEGAITNDLYLGADMVWSSYPTENR
jgi:hypothetical protein